MAELVGVVASGISIATLAVQIASSIGKLRSCWNELKEQPEDILLLIEELEDLNTLLSNIRDELDRDSTSQTILASHPASKCLEHCQRGASRLQELVDDLSIDITKARGVKLKWISAKAMMSKDKIARYKSRLESSIRLLSLSYQFYTRALVQQQPEIIVTHLARRINSLKLTETTGLNLTPSKSMNDVVLSSQSPTMSNGSILAQTQPLLNNSTHRVQDWRMKHTQRTRLLDITIQFINSAWEMELIKSWSGWTFNFRTYNYIPSDSLIFEAVENHDLETIKELFRTGEASINDVTIRLWDSEVVTLATAASLDLHIPTFQFLLEEGADPHYVDITFNLITNNPNLQDPEALEQALRLLVNNHDIDIPISSLGNFRGSGEAFLVLQNHAETSYFDAPFKDRERVATQLASSPDANGPENFRLALQPGPLLSLHVQEESSELLHAVAGAVGKVVRAISNPYFFSPEDRNTAQDLLGWRSLLRELIMKGADLNGTRPTILMEEFVTRFQTPFLSLFQYRKRFDAELTLPYYDCNDVLKIWLEDLQACGVDLLDYGNKEKSVHNRLPMNTHFEFYDRPPKGSSQKQFYSRHLVNLTFGASPSDWHVEVAECATKQCLVKYLGYPWEVVGAESPPNLIPGGWIDD